ncbi:MAG: arsenate reductase (glutaredoxin) [Epsilonproteobacteria bacterium]|nr:MAG: arsenate reductase (glutaredoxin) [Campylobacterota bacterium]RLA67334.1 MAG: arsenate reductase (glutaredoxin) [Campylobacterota bacterium]
MSYLYYHNPKCSKSRQGLELLEKNGINYEIKEYLKEPITQKEIKELSKQLNLKPLDFIRKKEQIYKDLDLGNKNLTMDQWCKIIAENPKLLERPILTNGKKAIIGRPTKSLLELL